MNRSQAHLVNQLIRMFQAGGRSRLLAIGLVVVVAGAWFFFPDLFGRNGGGQSNGPAVVSQRNDDENGDSGAAVAERNNRSTSDTSDGNDRSANGQVAQQQATGQQSASEGTSQGTSGGQSELRELGRDVYLSSGGLKYTRGSRHGHRLDHVVAHGKDEPNRAGSHGVFQPGDKSAIVTLLDEAYELAQAGGRGVVKKVEDRRTVYTIDMGRVVGYVGGQTGNRRGRPDTRHIRMVLEGNRVITAFPLVP